MGYLSGLGSWLRSGWRIAAQWWFVNSDFCVLGLEAVLRSSVELGLA
jgi:hypothetical protein